MHASGRVGHYESIDGLERFEEKVFREPHMKDDFLELAASLGYEFPHTPLLVRLDATHFGHRSKMPPVTVGRYDQTLSLNLGIRF